MNSAILEMIAGTVRSAQIRTPKDKQEVLERVREELGIVPERTDNIEGSNRILSFIEAGKRIGKHAKFFARNRTLFRPIKSKTGKPIGITERELARGIERMQNAEQVQQS